ncbi:MAG: hypothetical protein JO328_04845 [Hyphomicrobiales bacterium]|nr:hypothetical protein [Hyphomicrobiales bacterium]MBV8825553.1 hypothetical protein [Hyphomicrobiales bacterium]MBV9430126.1 hypothetical protein [Bradyrhizobiaceae bacterium]
MRDLAPAEEGLIGGARPSAFAVKHVVVKAAAATLFAIYLWLIFYTMPHVSFLDPDSATYLHLSPIRTVGIYYFSQVVFALWNDFYAIAAAQGALLGSASLFLFYALFRTTGSAALALSALAICLFKTDWITDTQWVNSDSLFASACLALLAAAILIWQRPSPVRIGLFVFFGFAASILRPIGSAIVWPLVFVLALRLWWDSRRALGTIVAGCLGIHLVSAAIEFAHFGIFSPAQLGFAMIGGAGFIADENASTEIPYAREFAASTAKFRSEYRDSTSWSQKFEVMDRYYNSITWQIAFPRLFAMVGQGPKPTWNDIIEINRIMEAISSAAIRYNPAGYGDITLVKLVGGASMIFRDSPSDLQSAFTQGIADRSIAFARSYPDKLPPEPGWTHFGNDDEITRLAGYISNWEAASLDLKHDVARPLRDLVGLLAGDTITRLFVFVTAVLVLITIGTACWRKRVGDCTVFLLLFVAPPWANLLAVSLTHLPLPRYIEITGPFASIALLAAAWVLAKSVADRFPLIRARSTVPPAVEQENVAAG